MDNYLILSFIEIEIEIAIGIEIDPLNSDFDSEPDSDFNYQRIRTVMFFAGFRFDLKI